jgi:HEAT repeat protein
MPVPAPLASTDESKTVAAELMGTADADWDKTLARIRDTKGDAYTKGLVQAIKQLAGDRAKAARSALAERLTRMTAETLRSMMKDKEVELRRGAVLAMAMKDDKAHIPDLITALLDEEESVVRAARAGLKAVSGEDFGPKLGASLADRAAAAKAWLDWLRKHK